MNHVQHSTNFLCRQVLWDLFVAGRLDGRGLLGVSYWTGFVCLKYSITFGSHSQSQFLRSHYWIPNPGPELSVSMTLCTRHLVVEALGSMSSRQGVHPFSATRQASTQPLRSWLTPVTAPHSLYHWARLLVTYISLREQGTAALLTFTGA